MADKPRPSGARHPRFYRIPADCRLIDYTWTEWIRFSDTFIHTRTNFQIAWKRSFVSALYRTFNKVVMLQKASSGAWQWDNIRPFLSAQSTWAACSSSRLTISRLSCNTATCSGDILKHVHHHHYHHHHRHYESKSVQTKPALTRVQRPSRQRFCDS